MSIQHSVLGSDERYYKNIGIQKHEILQWEDGNRTNGEIGTFEWWYFDAHLEDGSTLVIVFYTKEMIAPNKPYKPFATLEWNSADGKHYSERVDASDYNAVMQADKCNIRFNDCSFSGDLHHYNIRFKNQNIDVQVQLTGSVPAWRPETGHIYFGDRDEYYFAWLPAVPEGKTEVDIKTGDQTQHYTGTGYHDHNWGNIPMMKVINHWYWGRAKIGRYQVISSYIIAEKKYGYNTFPIFMIAKDGKIIADNANDHLSFLPENRYIDTHTGKPVYNRLVYDYNDGEQHYKIIYNREQDILNGRMIDSLKGPKKLVAKLLGFNGAYLRFSGTVSLQSIENGQAVETISAPAVWELMFFGSHQ